MLVNILKAKLFTEMMAVVTGSWILDLLLLTAAFIGGIYVNEKDDPLAGEMTVLIV